MGYGLAVGLFREISIAQWNVLTGLRLTVFLLAPYAYWPALIVGESGYFIGLSFQCGPDYGMAWAVLNAIPSSLYVAPLMYWIRERLRPVAKDYSVDMGALLGGALLVSICVMSISMLLFYVMKLPPGYKIHNLELISRYLIGNYLGALTVTPLALFIHQLSRGAGWRVLYRRAVNNSVFFETAALALPVFAFLLWLGINTPPHAPMRQMVQVAMFLPVVWLALRHGSKGGAVGGTLASGAVMLLMPELRDPSTLQAEVVLAFAISTMLLMGARITALDGRAKREEYDIGMAYALAQRNVYIGEMQLRMTSHAVEQIQESVQMGFATIMGRLRQLQPAVDDRGYQRQARVAQDQLHRLADSLYPRALRDRGLLNALKDGTMAGLLEEGGLTYSCDLRGPLSQLSYTLRLTIYRIVWEAVAEACARKDISDIQLRIRGIHAGGRQGAIVSVHFHADPVRLKQARWDDLLPRIARSTSGLGLQAIRDRAGLFGGRTRTRAWSDGWRISALLFDPVLPSND
ncbi:MASE1 domain-containing protein [Dyella acidiphila]|uniref:MASE1 domain-containing protein n=1 Tax=Dyella acidiphila TaxID=2775866 RepID=A0ABR9GEY5_9GAMM|nr:MASE1 domain-containing protein [Dyella acidiphila]